MTILRTVPAVLAVLLMGAHFLRRGEHATVFLCAAFVPVLFVRRGPARFVALLLLVACGIGWLVIAWQLAEIRKAAGMPYLRMALILGGVAVFTFLAAWLLPQTRRPDG
jgi:hypothetical protein